jgi:hypothetical protein
MEIGGKLIHLINKPPVLQSMAASAIAAIPVLLYRAEEGIFASIDLSTISSTV